MTTPKSERPPTAPQTPQDPAPPGASSKVTFKELYARHARTVLQGIAGFGVRGEERFDIAQNAWTRIHRQLSSFRGENERAWVAAAARAAWLDWCRTRRRHPEHEQTTEDEPPADTRTPERAAIDRERMDLLAALLLRFVPDEEQRHAFVMFEIFGMTVPEIAAETRESTTTIQGRIRMARTKLEQALTPEEREQLRAVLPVISVDAFTEALRNSATDDELAKMQRRVAHLLEAPPPTGAPDSSAEPAPDAAQPPSNPPPSAPAEGPTADTPVGDTPAGYVLSGKQLGAGAVGFFALGAVVASLLSGSGAKTAATVPPISSESEVHGALHPAAESHTKTPADAIEAHPTAVASTSSAPAPAVRGPVSSPARSSTIAALDPEWESETLLSRASGQIVREPAQALSMLAEHARRFPGRGADDRELLSIRALLKLGRRAEAEHRGRALLARAAWLKPQLVLLLGASTF